MNNKINFLINFNDLIFIYKKAKPESIMKFAITFKPRDAKLYNLELPLIL